MTDPKVLIVDDEAPVVEIYQLQLGDTLTIDTAESGEAGLAAIAANGPYAVVVSDMHMPGMTGTEFLQRVEESSPRTIRIMLTADCQQDVAVDAVNEGHIFRFLNKPCPADRLELAIRAGLEQYRLVTAEREVLTKTLNGSIGLLTEILSIVSPTAFGRANRIKALVEDLCVRSHVKDSWEITLAAMLSQVGCVSLPESLLKKLERGEALNPEESQLLKSCPQLAHDLVSRIPRLERIARLIAVHQHAYSDALAMGGSNDRRTIAERAGFLKVALDYDDLVQRGVRPEGALFRMARRQGVYADDAFKALEQIVEEMRDDTVREIAFSDLVEGMVLADDITNSEGVALITKGNRVTNWLLERLRHQKQMGRPVYEPIRIVNSEARDGAASRATLVPAATA